MKKKNKKSKKRELVFQSIDEYRKKYFPNSKPEDFEPQPERITIIIPLPGV
jgi:hypothetical protein